MKVFKITRYYDMKNIKKYLKNEIIVDLEECSTSLKRRVMSFILGLLYLNGKFKKISKNQYIVKVL